MTVLKCDRCGVAQKDPKDIEEWVNAEMTVYMKHDDYITVHEHWCPKCHKEIANVRYAAENERRQLMQDPFSRSVFVNGGAV